MCLPTSTWLAWFVDDDISGGIARTAKYGDGEKRTRYIISSYNIFLFLLRWDWYCMDGVFRVLAVALGLVLMACFGRKPSGSKLQYTYEPFVRVGLELNYCST